MRLIALLLVLVAVLGPATPAPANVQAPEATDDEFAPLREAFSTLLSSLRATGGVRDQDRPAVAAQRDMALAFADAHPGHRESLAGALQISIWLEDHDQVHALFGRLADAMPDNEKLRSAWLRYFERQEDPARVEAIYDQLLARFPDDAELRVTRAETLKRKNEYARAIDVLRAPGLDIAAHPRAALVLSSCLVAEHRFQEAVDVLGSVDDEQLTGNPVLARQIEQALLTAGEYVDWWIQEQDLRYEEVSAGDLPQAELATAKGVIAVVLFEDQASNTVANFVKLAESGFYDGIRFHRVLGNFMAQTGDPNSREGAVGLPGQGGPGYRIHDEHDREGARRHFSGSLAMANTGSPHSGGSQFYFTHEPTAHLNGKHTVFGRVLEGLDVVRRLELDDLLESVTITQKRDHPYEPQTLPEAVIALPPAPVTITPTTLPDTGDDGGE